MRGATFLSVNENPVGAPDDTHESVFKLILHRAKQFGVEVKITGIKSESIYLGVAFPHSLPSAFCLQYLRNLAQHFFNSSR